MSRRLSLALFACCAFLGAAAVGQAAELVMVRADWCEVCERWEDEVGVAYDKASEAERAPLRRVDYGADELGTLELSRRVDATPTFLLMAGGAEIGRIEGYTADHFFWSLLDELLQKLPETDGARPKS